MTRTQKPARKPRPGIGRPTREQAKRRHEQLLDEALEQFLEKGFVMTTIDAIAVAVGMTKRTVYARYPDKNALFGAAVQRAIERWIVPAETLNALDQDDLEGSLTAVAHLRMQNANSADGLRLQHILSAESYRFPEIFSLAYDQGTVPTLEFLAALLRKHTRAGTIDVRQPQVAAVAFLSMVIGTPVRDLLWGKNTDQKLLDERVRFCVQLFLDGARVRQKSGETKSRRNSGK